MLNCIVCKNGEDKFSHSAQYYRGYWFCCVDCAVDYSLLNQPLKPFDWEKFIT